MLGARDLTVIGICAVIAAVYWVIRIILRRNLNGAPLSRLRRSVDMLARTLAFATMLLFAYVGFVIMPLDASKLNDLASSSRRPKECPTEFQPNFDGHYARKAVWDRLPVVRNWFESVRESNAQLGAVFLDSKASNHARVGGTYGWHEGGSPCVQFRGDELWGGQISDSGIEWEGPYIRVAVRDVPSITYFNRLFGRNCYLNADGEKWCFGNGLITVGSKRYKASLHLDATEAPEYGNVVDVEGETDFWVFVAEGDGWKVFKDTWVTSDGHVDIDPKSSLPWQQLFLEDGAA